MAVTLTQPLSWLFGGRHEDESSDAPVAASPAASSSPSSSAALPVAPPTSDVIRVAASGPTAGAAVNASAVYGHDATSALSAAAAAAAATAAATAAAVQPRQTVASHSVAAVSVAASVESFFRSAMNAQINRALTRTRGPMFPRMHVQLPTRIVYINGFKGLRHFIEERVSPNALGAGAAPVVRLGMAIAPGLLMTPVSSVLEACNANLNPEPLHLRATRGVTARAGREVIFGVGLNQLSDEFTTFAPGTLPASLRGPFGSISAGVVAAFLSHVPHNLSTLKLMNPAKSYRQLLDDFARPWRSYLEARAPRTSEAMRARGAAVLACLAPVGLGVRMIQVVGSFVILNGIISLFPTQSLLPDSIRASRKDDHDE